MRKALKPIQYRGKEIEIYRLRNGKFPKMGSWYTAYVDLDGAQYLHSKVLEGAYPITYRSGEVIGMDTGFVFMSKWPLRTQRSTIIREMKKVIDRWIELVHEDYR